MKSIRDFTERNTQAVEDTSGNNRIFTVLSDITFLFFIIPDARVLEMN